MTRSINNPARVCAVITEEKTEAARHALIQAAQLADIAEIRLDYLRDFDFNSLESLRPLVEGRPLPVIITCRSQAEGGNQNIADPVRLRLLVEGARRWADYCDIEAAHYGEAARLSPDTSRLIVSYHNFTETPPDLNEIYERVCALPAAVSKIVTRANDITDALTVLGLLERAQSEGRSLIALAMGEAGLVTRLLGPSRGGFLTYGSLARGAESAPGQITCREMTRLYRVREISPATQITGIIAGSVKYSASTAIHNTAFAALGLDFVYIPFEVKNPADFFRGFVRAESRALDWSLRGLSVTIPHKRAVLPLLDEMDETAARIGAVNTVVVNGGRAKGYNTDAAGAIIPLARVSKIEGESAAVIGAGGAARAVVYGLVKGGARVTVFARDVDSARGLADEFRVALRPLEEFGPSDARVIINATPVGMRGHSEGASPVPAESLKPGSIVYDLVYNPIETRLLKDAESRGCVTLGGLDMLVAQAALQFELWTGRKPPVDVMRRAALERIYPAPA